MRSMITVMVAVFESHEHDYSQMQPPTLQAPTPNAAHVTHVKERGALSLKRFRLANAVSGVKMAELAVTRYSLFSAPSRFTVTTFPQKEKKALTLLCNCM